MTQKENFMFQNVAYRPTVYKTGVRLEKCTQLKRYMRDYDICQKSPFCLLYPSTIWKSISRPFPRVSSRNSRNTCSFMKKFPKGVAPPF